MNRFVLGITGGLASGKSTVLKILKRHGVQTISADDLAHACLRPGTDSYRAIVQRFGRPILLNNGEIDRLKLAEIVFRSMTQRRALERVIHPPVIKGLKEYIGRHRGLVALDIPLLFEKRLTRLVDRTWVVYGTRSQQIRRYIRRTGLSRTEALRRIRAQMPLDRKVQLADTVLINTSSIVNLEKKVAHELTVLKKEFIKNT